MQISLLFGWCKFSVYFLFLWEIHGEMKIIEKIDQIYWKMCWKYSFPFFGGFFLTLIVGGDDAIDFNPQYSESATWMT